MALYRRPANLFVATFLGSPEMNIVRGRLVAEGGVPGLHLADGLALPLTGLQIDSGWLDRDLDIGLRPEHLLRCPAGETPHFGAQFDMIEPIGSEAFAYLRYGPHALVARFAPEDLPEPGGILPLRVAPGHWHVFDPASGLRLTAAG